MNLAGDGFPENVCMYSPMHDTVLGTHDQIRYRVTDLKLILADEPSLHSHEELFID